jgi:hypothetical protein
LLLVKKWLSHYRFFYLILFFLPLLGVLMSF